MVERAGYGFIPGPFQYSAGVAARPGFAIERVRFARPVPLADGFARIEAFLKARRQPLAAFCACELRSPAPFTDAGFIAFNRDYVGTLQRWGIVAGDVNPVARSNVCPEIAPPPTPSFHAFCYVLPAADAARSFVVAGSGEARE
ncbi:MAG: 2-amino-5-chloromuconate deaminase CnbZ, partial [Acetobacteraceae bacterium]